MAARKRPYSPAKLAIIRDRIRVGMLLNRLQKHVVGELEMSQTQLRAAEILLKKCVPDMTAVEHSGEITHKRAADLTDDVLLGIASGSGDRATEAQSSPQVAPSVH